ncbi:hypothetical protein HDV05_007257 [Chytridiales sp. JEL 0842]|nr:hypothetical protein HDV05_007257 [Chytridiales sp. JEL 0842]
MSNALKCMADFCVIPIGLGTSVSKEIAECQRILAKSGLKYQMHSYGTNVEGDWDDVMKVIKTCHETLHANGVARISTTIKIGTRTDKEQTMEDKVAVVKKILAQDA